MAQCRFPRWAFGESQLLTQCQWQRRPGILVLINDSDWELEGEDKYELVNNDTVLFVSTLHGG